MRGAKRNSFPRLNLFNGKRWLNGGKTALIKIGEHYSENNVFCKAVVGFGEGFTDS